MKREINSNDIGIINETIACGKFRIVLAIIIFIVMLYNNFVLNNRMLRLVLLSMDFIVLLECLFAFIISSINSEKLNKEIKRILEEDEEFKQWIESIKK